MTAESRPTNAPSTFLQPYRWRRVALFVLFFGFGMFAFLIDGRSGWITATFCAVLLAAFVFAPPIRFCGRAWSPLILGLPAFFLGLPLLDSLLPVRATPKLAFEDSRSIIQQLDVYRLKAGHFPATLEEASIVLPRYRGGVQFFYRREKDGHCSLEIGNYHLDNFNARWNSKERLWVDGFVEGTRP